MEEKILKKDEIGKLYSEFGSEYNFYAPVKKKGNIVFEMRVGLNTGDVVAGIIGCDLKLEYTSIGETTNLANRMEAKCEVGHVLMYEDTFEQIKDITFQVKNNYYFR